MPHPRTSRPNAEDFWETGLVIMGRNNARATEKTLTAHFISFFGCEPTFISILWFLLDRSGWLKYRKTVEARHLLWTLHFLKVYSTERVSAIAVKCDEKTFRETVWFMLKGIAKLDNLLVRTLIYTQYYLSF